MLGLVFKKYCKIVKWKNRKTSVKTCARAPEGLGNKQRED